MLNNTRLQILLKGFANTADIMKFVPCIHKKAKEIHDEIEKKVEEEGKVMHPSGINTKRLIDYLGMRESDIVKYAELERNLADKE